MSLSDAEKSACICLSTLFLDNEMTSAEVDDMAQSLYRLRLPITQLDDLLRNDVFPVLRTNLFSMAGVWGYFDETELINRITSHRRQPRILEAKAWAGLAGLVTGDWAQVKEKMRQLKR
ncbi:hypothetical protein GGR54DRAFT_92399 [Hypoxylon sp. NC1633]|nr:hypothetical protein GGR54DRAFT_92399 [Hypoxylon sp. NC1633]